MWNHRKSTVCSLVCTRVVMAALVVAAVFLPKILNFYEIKGTIGEENIVPIMVVIYCCYVPAFIALLKLDRLLTNIKKAQVFIAENVRCLRIISWCCFAAAAVILIGAKYYTLFVIVAVAMAFMGLILRVVKNVIEEAVVIKEENDYTI